MLTSWSAQEKHSTINKSGIFANCKCLLEIYSVYKHFRSSNFYVIEICVFYSMFLQQLTTGFFCYMKTMSILWTYCERHCSREFLTWCSQALHNLGPPLFPNFSFIFLHSNHIELFPLVPAPVSHFLLYCYSKWFTSTPRKGKSAEPFSLRHPPSPPPHPHHHHF